MQILQFKMILKSAYIPCILSRSSLKFISRCKHKRKDSEKLETKTSPDVVNYVDSQSEYNDIRDKIPKSLLRKYKAPESMYLINKKTAKDIAKELNKYLDKSAPIVEVNPGFCLLSQELIKKVDHLYVYESSNNFMQIVNDFQSSHPNKITLKMADFFGMWKLVLQDKLDQGNRTSQLLGTLATNNNDRVIRIIGAMPSLLFIKHLIYTIVFHYNNSQLGRPELWIAMPCYHYDLLKDNVTSKRYRTISALFQLLFDSRIITKLPKAHYLPWISTSEQKQSLKDENFLYLVNISQKEKLPCSSEYLPLLWYFFRPYVVAKKTRVIPMLEQWIPGCGVWLITGQDPPDSNKKLGPTEDDAKLPHMTIFTEFGDLTLAQKTTVFKRFISWPGFEQSLFRATMENNLPKSISTIDAEDKDKMKIIDTHLDDEDLESSDLES